MTEVMADMDFRLYELDNASLCRLKARDLPEGLCHVFSKIFFIFICSIVLHFKIIPQFSKQKYHFFIIKEQQTQKEAIFCFDSNRNWFTIFCDSLLVEL
jgi:hypothetical protein